LVVSPAAIAMKLFGKDPLRRRLEPEEKTYWIERNTGVLGPDIMKNQF
jgi:hypothetical protein